MQKIENIRIEGYNYNLHEERIAKFPLEKREQSKLLFLHKNQISEKKFSEIPDLLPENSFLVFNETKVIQARLLFRKSTGAMIEIFCLEPVVPSGDFQIAFQQKPPVTWKCLVGNAKRWKEEDLVAELHQEGQLVKLKARKIEKLSDFFLVEFSWEPYDLSFSEVIESSGLVPLPPYLNREAVASDKERYQTVYARYDGSVAAPTAGLHFTDSILRNLEQKGIVSDKVTLHVGAGTFKPVIADTAAEHKMHTEKIVVGLPFLENLIQNPNRYIIPVGTTSMRTLESLYWLAKRVLKNDHSMVVDQWDPYNSSDDDDLSPDEALRILTEYLKDRNLNELKAETRLMIAPGYQFKYARGIITNFHQPKSTLLLLVAALLGDVWKEAYKFALDHDFRFLSYGDSCLFLP